MLTPVIYPWDFSDDWTEEDWLNLNPVDVPINSLRPSQEGISLKAMARVLEDVTEYIGKAIFFEGQLILWDGHHHWLRDLLQGKTSFKVRIRQWVGHA